MNDETYLISWCHKFSDIYSKDYWQVRDNLQEAYELYNAVLHKGPYIASISAVVQSTDYDIHPKLRGLIDETNQTSTIKPA